MMKFAAEDSTEKEEAARLVFTTMTNKKNTISAGSMFYFKKRVSLLFSVS